jgi:FAD/FMN-containing dehydrogenase
MTLIAFEHFHGAVARVAVTDTPVPHREVGYNVLVTSVWTDPAETDANLAWTQGVYDELRPFFVDRRWLNYFSEDDREDAVRAAYGPNYDRLVEVKRKYDPDNVFHLNHNIDPAG